jgi:chaperonin GroES
MSKDSTKKVPFLPLNGKLLVEPEKRPKVTASGLYLADNSASSEKPQIGFVVRVGIEKLDEKGSKVPFAVKAGQKVMFRKYSGDEFEYEGERYLILDEDSIIGIFEDE